jgi:formate/nitrite transporter FocA (FNT family)
LLKAIACGFLVTLAMFFGTRNHDGISKALGLHLSFSCPPEMYPPTVEYMYLTSIGMMLRAPLSIGGFLWKCMLPITHGKSAGGAVLVESYNWWVYLHCENGKRKSIGFLGLDGTKWLSQADEDMFHG